jgi:hypothetical protein
MVKAAQSVVVVASQVLRQGRCSLGGAR